MENEVKLRSDIKELEKLIAKTSKVMNRAKADVKEEKIKEIIQYQARIDEINRQIEKLKDSSERDYRKHAVPIKSTMFYGNDDKTDVLISTEHEIINRPVDVISGTEVLYMNMDRRIREREYQTTIKNTIMKNMKGETDAQQIVVLSAKLNAVNTNLSKLEAALG